MTIAGIQLAELSETRASQAILAKGRVQRGQREAARLVLRQLHRRAEHAQPEELAEALLGFGLPAVLTTWLETAGRTE